MLRSTHNRSFGFLLLATVHAILGAEKDGGVAAQDAAPEIVQRIVNNYCLDCHNRSDFSGGLDLESALATGIEPNSGLWEKVVRKLRARQMPPLDAQRPEESEYVGILNSLEQVLDAQAALHPHPGRTETFRRLTRFEYQNAIRELLSLDIDASTLLPADEASHGFDNTTVGELSPTLLNRYISAAQKISRLAVGQPQKSPGGTTIRIPPDVTQEEQVEGLPIGTRGGILIPFTFPLDGEYEIRVRLARDRDEHVEGLTESHELEVLMDLGRIGLFTVKPPRGNSESANTYGKPSHDNVDQHLVAKVHVRAGPHQVGVTFLKNPSSLLETKRQPLNVHYNMYRHPRIGPAVYQVTIAGPFQSNGPGDTPSRRRLFVRWPTSVEADEDCAREIVASLLRRACRRPIVAEDMLQPMALYHAARSQGSFEDGIEMALSSVLIHPEFLFRVERDPAELPPQTPYRISDITLASRLSFFLWGSPPDDELLALAERGQLSEPEVLRQQTMRLLKDKRSHDFITNFVGQWLYLRNLDSIVPDGRLYPDFDDNLRQAFRQETEMFFESILRENRSVLDILQADYTYLNERLAKHYGIPHVYGSRFRRVSLDRNSQRGGLLRHGSILTVTSYATRTSLVIRGKWVLENILGTPPPPPPENVPALEDNTVSAKLQVRQRLAQHRANPACASCHNLIDPIGFSLENFDAMGRWRDLEEGSVVDASGSLPDGRRVEGVSGLEQGLLGRPELFVGTMAEKLLTYAVGRGIEPNDAPAIRQIVRNAKSNDFRFSSLILGIVESTPFQMKMSK